MESNYNSFYSWIAPCYVHEHIICLDGHKAESGTSKANKKNTLALNFLGLEWKLKKN